MEFCSKHNLHISGVIIEEIGGVDQKLLFCYVLERNNDSSPDQDMLVVEQELKHYLMNKRSLQYRELRRFLKIKITRK